MAEILLKIGTVGPDPAYQDGDIVCAWNTETIECCHAQMLCCPRVGGRREVTAAGHRIDPLGLSQLYYEQTSQYRFERLTRDTVRRVTLADQSEQVFGLPEIDVPLYVARRLSHAKNPAITSGGKALFGTPGAEVWYGGNRRMDATILTTIWNAIETATPERRANYQRWPLTPTEKRHFLGLAVDDFTTPEQVLLTTAVYDETVPEAPVLLKKRARRVGWDAIVAPNLRNRIRDRAEEIDIRDTQTFARAAIVEVK